MKVEEKMSEQTAMCPKHGVEHGVCVDPVRADQTEKPEKPCPDCGKTWCFGERHICTVSPANRFDPYEALDTIQQIVDCGTQEDGASLITEMECGTLYRHVCTLRAYITGMER